MVYIAAERFDETARRLEAAAGDETPAVYASRSRPQLASEEDLGELIKGDQSRIPTELADVALVVIDTLARCATGIDENSSKETGFIVAGLTRIVEAVPSAAVAVLHHTRKGAAEMRGSSALAGGSTCASIDGESSHRRLIVEKANTVAEGQTLGFRLELRNSRAKASSPPWRPSRQRDAPSIAVSRA